MKERRDGVAALGWQTNDLLDDQSSPLERWKIVHGAGGSPTASRNSPVHDSSSDTLPPGAAPADAAFSTLYNELRRVAERELRRAGNAGLLSPTTILHETYLAMAGREGNAFPDRGHFMAYASKAMRGLVIDAARGRSSLKRGGGFHITSLRTELQAAGTDAAGLEQLGDALDALGVLDERLAQVVDLKFFCGFSFAEIGAMLKLSERTVQRDWDKARILLHRFLRDDE